MDRHTIEAAIAGDTDALGAIVQEFAPTVTATAYGLCGDWELAGDVSQEVFTTMVARLGDLRDPAALAGWLVALTRTAARRQRPRRATGLAERPLPGPEDYAIEADDARRLRHAVEALPQRLRLPMVLHYFAAQRVTEIAALCELPVSTVKQRMRVARALLRVRIEMPDKQVPTRSTAVDASASDVVQVHAAMRSGDVKRLAAMLEARPDLVDAREDWSREDGFAHRLPPNGGGGTPLLRAVERGDRAMVELLLTRGADPNASCTCAGGENPLWVGVLQRETAIVRLLLAHGAEPDATAFTGTTAVDVARMRGYDELVELLVNAGATPAEPRPRSSAPPRAAAATGIKTIDLWCPLPERGLVHLTPGFGIGAMVLVAELSARAARAGHHVVWTGFVPAPTDLGDIRHALAECALVDDVVLFMAPHTVTRGEQVAALDRGVAHAAPDGALLVVFSETGSLHLVEERLAALAARPGVTLVVGPLDGSSPPPRPDGSPYLASIEFDRDRAVRGRWPAVGSASWSKVADQATAALADRARAHMTDELDEYLAQPFFVAEHVLDTPGEHVPVDELRSRVEALVGDAQTS
jgi:RNA polymerase sigma factor (sigma-70 family)